MRHSRRQTDQERRQIVWERAKGASVSALSAALKVSPKTVYNVLGRGRSAVSANDSRTRVLTMRVITAQLPVSGWHQMIGEPTIADAILDRIIHNAPKLSQTQNCTPIRGSDLRAD